ncbi:unnamed protein product [Merluccius merluccius]
MKMEVPPRTSSRQQEVLFLQPPAGGAVPPAASRRMEDDSLPEDCDITVGGVDVLNQSECICSEPTATDLSSTSPAPFKADPAHIKEAAGDDLCLRFVLSCVYCELLSVCSTLEACLTCPGGGAICCCEFICCCCSGEAEGVTCGEEACQTLVDCGAECCSSNFLDFCLECCSFVFPS